MDDKPKCLDKMNYYVNIIRSEFNKRNILKEIPAHRIYDKKLYFKVSDISNFKEIIKQASDGGLICKSITNLGNWNVEIVANTNKKMIFSAFYGNKIITITNYH